MNVRELKDLLDGLDDDVEVRLMHQPHWPFEYSISNSVLASEINFVPEGYDRAENADQYPDDDIRSGELQDGDVLYLCEGSQLGYGTRNAWQ